MKISLFKNDKSTAKDEIIILLFLVLMLITGVVLIITQPQIYILNEILVPKSMTIVCGVIFVLTFVMFIPGIVYRFTENNRKGK